LRGSRWRKELESLCDTSTEIVIVSRDNYIVFTPMLPEVAGRYISPFHVADSRTSSYQTLAKLRVSVEDRPDWRPCFRDRGKISIPVQIVAEDESAIWHVEDGQKTRHLRNTINVDRM
jgi:hypothetical protein